MNVEDAILVLEKHNKWRRGDDEVEFMEDPVSLGEAIDVVVTHIKGEESVPTEKSKNTIRYGDLILENDHELGFSIFDLNGKKKCFFNKKGEEALVKWIMNKDNVI